MNKYVCLVICVAVVCVTIVVCYITNCFLECHSKYYIGCDIVNGWQTNLLDEILDLSGKIKYLEEQIQKNNELSEKIYNEYVEKELLK